MSPSETNTSLGLCQQQKPRQFLIFFIFYFFIFLNQAPLVELHVFSWRRNKPDLMSAGRGLFAGGARRGQVEQSLQAHEVSDLVSRSVQARIWQPAGNCALETAPSLSKPWEGLKEASLHSVLMDMATGRASRGAGACVLVLVAVPLPFGIPKRMRTGIRTGFWSVKDMAHRHCLGRSCTRAGERLRRDFHTRDAHLGVTQGQLSAQGFPGWFGM